MVKIKPFRGIRPPRKYAAEVASRPYDVLNSQEAKKEATEKSLLHIIKPEIDFDPIADEHCEEVYRKAVENFRRWRERGWLVQDDEEKYYVYAQTMDGRTQYGLVAACHFDDYVRGRIKKHELTRPDKEEDRMIHVRNQNANIEPVFFSYPANAEMDMIVRGVVENNPPEYDFTAADGFGHRFWVIDDQEIQRRITEIFDEIPALYVADGHHRTAAAARVAEEKMRANGAHTGNEEYCYFLAVIFPDSQLKIIDYNRVVKDLNGLSPGAAPGAREGFHRRGQGHGHLSSRRAAQFLDVPRRALVQSDGTRRDLRRQRSDRGTGRDGPFGARAGPVAGHQRPAHGQADRLRRRYPGARRVAAPGR